MSFKLSYLMTTGAVIPELEDYCKIFCVCALNNQSNPLVSKLPAKLSGVDIAI